MDFWNRTLGDSGISGFGVTNMASGFSFVSRGCSGPFVKLIENEIWLPFSRSLSKPWRREVFFWFLGINAFGKCMNSRRKMKENNVV